MPNNSNRNSRANVYDAIFVALTLRQFTGFIRLEYEFTVPIYYYLAPKADTYSAMLDWLVYTIGHRVRNGLGDLSDNSHSSRY